MKTEPLTTSESLMLDIIRTLAAFLVAYGHLSQPYFSTGWKDLTVAARASVGVFFVLSGFVIRYVTCRRSATFSHYLCDRASRIYSVAIPALILTLVADSIARHVNPAFYMFWEPDHARPLFRIFANLIFCGQLRTYLISPLSNSPFWSLNYEVIYYLLYGFAFYFVGKRRIFSIILLCFVAGPRILYLSPLWFAGCVIHDLYQRWNQAGTLNASLNRLLAVSAALLAVLIAASYRDPHLWGFGWSRAVNHFVWIVPIKPQEYVFGFFWAVLFIKLLQWARSFSINSDTRTVKTIRFIAEGTFPIYLTHFPIYVLIAACIPYNHASSFSKIIIFISVLSFGVLLGHPANIFKKWLRSLPTKFTPSQKQQLRPSLEN
jgi:peptidoglycan/LPS O-acetylase OafA/YrhL